MKSRKEELREKIDILRFDDIDESIWDIFDEYENLCVAEDDNDGLMYVRYCMGEASFRFGHYLDAISQLNDFVYKSWRRVDEGLISRSLNILGMTYYALGYSPTALDNYLSAAEYAIKAKDPRQEIVVYINTGWLYRDCGDYFKALEFYKKALRIFHSSGLFQAYDIELICNGYIAQIYFKMNNPEAALPYIKVAQEHYVKNHNDFYDIAVKNALIRYFSYIGDSDSFNQVAESVIEDSKNSNDFLEFFEAYIDICDFLIPLDKKLSRRLLSSLWQPVISSKELSFLKLRLQKLEIQYSKMYLSIGDYQKCCGDYFVIQDDFDVINQQNLVAGLANMEKLRSTEKERQLYFEKSQKDLMTGLLNKVCFEQNVRDTLYSRKANAAQPCAFALIDIDHFKNINDTLGHSNGDSVIISVANEAKKIFNNQCIIGRVGGDEFGIFWNSVLSIDVVTEELELLADNVQTSVLKQFCESESTCPIVTMSIGLVYESSPDADYENLFSRADIQLYLAKSSGRDTIRVENQF